MTTRCHHRSTSSWSDQGFRYITVEVFACVHCLTRQTTNGYIRVREACPCMNAQTNQDGVESDLGTCLRFVPFMTLSAYPSVRSLVLIVHANTRIADLYIRLLDAGRLFSRLGYCFTPSTHFLCVFVPQSCYFSRRMSSLHRRQGPLE